MTNATFGRYPTTTRNELQRPWAGERALHPAAEGLEALVSRFVDGTSPGVLIA